MKTPFLIAVTLVFLSPGIVAQSQSDFSYPEPARLPEKKLVIWATQYYVHEFKSNGTIPFVDKYNQPLGLYGDTCDFCMAALEGTASITDSSGKVFVVNFANTGDSAFVDCRKCSKYAKSKLSVESWGKTRWSISSGFGDGVKNYRLVPFRTIAVDPKTIPYGSVIYVPSAKGVVIELPNGEKVTHDGYFFAGDTGGAIKQNHIDVFTGTYTGNPFKTLITSNLKKTVEAYLVEDVNLTNGLKKIHVK
ncbi:MAG TPA: 3D domain-containing protein [Fluviicola sp.]|nr:3D domain-containing protein [Fluviicola sp.]